MVGPTTGDKQLAAQRLAEELLGSSAVLPDDVPIDDLEFCQFLDDQVRLCETCSWWVETHEIDANGRKDCGVSNR